MRKSFWIIYGIVFVLIAGGGGFFLVSLNKTNDELDNELERKRKEIAEIETKMQKGDIPNKVWGNYWKERLNTYRDIENSLKSHMNKYNSSVKKRLGRIDNALFAEDFKKVWVHELRLLLDSGFEVSSNTITSANVKEQFETGNLAADFGIAFTWKQMTPTNTQRQIAEEQYWIQKKLINMFMTSELENGWKDYEFKRQEQKEEEAKRKMPGMSGRMAMAAEEKIPPPGIKGIFFGITDGTGRGGHKGFAGLDDRSSFVATNKYMDEYHFSMECRMRLSSLEGFLNRSYKDEEFFFMIDSLLLTSITAGTGEEKLGREFKHALKPENEPPVEALLRGRVATFHFDRLTMKKKDDKKKDIKRGSKRTKERK